MNVKEHANMILKNGWGVIVPHLIHEEEILENFSDFLKEITSKGFSVKIQNDTSGFTIQIEK